MDSRSAAPQTLAEPKAGESQVSTGPLPYIVAIALGILSGWVNQAVDDPLLTALCVVAFAMIMGSWKKGRPWRWMLLVWIGVPLTMGYYAWIVRLPHSRGDVYATFLQILAASAGAHGGHFMREFIDRVFLKQDD
ncbi:MAG TPA: hypothetical protein VFB04_01250 [Terriglobales bacterium]|nr:hypothetical protein [Terriglobales bacterium]